MVIFLLKPSYVQHHSKWNYRQDAKGAKSPYISPFGGADTEKNAVLCKFRG